MRMCRVVVLWRLQLWSKGLGEGLRPRPRPRCWAKAIRPLLSAVAIDAVALRNAAIFLQGMQATWS